jgi:sulfur carrier protein
MEISVNGEKKVIEKQSLTITETLVHFKVESPDMVSVQLNDKFIPRNGFDLTNVRDGDHIDFLYFMGGGR